MISAVIQAGNEDVLNYSRWKERPQLQDINSPVKVLRYQFHRCRAVVLNLGCH
jgi:hypothetical protein